MVSSRIAARSSRSRFDVSEWAGWRLLELLFLTAWNAHRAQLPGVLLVLTDAILPLFFIGLGLHARFVLRPRLQRELEELS